MNILWITRQSPGRRDSGELIYSGGLLDSLGGRPGTTVTVIAHPAGDPVRSGAPCGWLLPPAATRRRAFSLASHLPSDAYRLSGAAIRDALRARLREDPPIDAIVIDQAACAWALDLLGSDHRRVPVVYVAHNVEAAIRPSIARGSNAGLPLRLIQRLDARKYGRLERRLCRRAALITAITSADADAFRQSYPETPVRVVPPGYEATPHPREPITAATPRRALIVGSFEWIAKQANLHDFLGACARRLADAGVQVQVVGKATAEFVARTCREFPGVDFHSNVPSISPYLADARIGLVIDALGGGFKLKSLDYIYHGVPVAGLAGAIQDLPVDRESDLIVEDSYPALADSVIARIDDVDSLDAMRHRALEKCLPHFLWSRRGDDLYSALQNLPVNPPRDPPTAPARRPVTHPAPN